MKFTVMLTVILLSVQVVSAKTVSPEFQISSITTTEVTDREWEDFKSNNDITEVSQDQDTPLQVVDHQKNLEDKLNDTGKIIS